jgi:hypothetical protein
MLYCSSVFLDLQPIGHMYHFIISNSLLLFRVSELLEMAEIACLCNFQGPRSRVDFSLEDHMRGPGRYKYVQTSDLVLAIIEQKQAHPKSPQLEAHYKRHRFN